jgi:hypothetical protein
MVHRCGCEPCDFVMESTRRIDLYQRKGATDVLRLPRRTESACDEVVH